MLDQSHADQMADLNLMHAQLCDAIVGLARKSPSFRTGLVQAIREADRGIGGTGGMVLQDPPARPAPIVPALAEMEAEARVDALPRPWVQICRGMLILAGVAANVFALVRFPSAFPTIRPYVRTKANLSRHAAE
jgi:hypothetical protein